MKVVSSKTRVIQNIDISGGNFQIVFNLNNYKMGWLPFNKSISGYIVDGEWSNWSNYGDCSVTCGNGTRIRSRECNSPEPSGGGSPCSGESQQTDECKTITCPGGSLILF